MKRFASICAIGIAILWSEIPLAASPSENILPIAPSNLNAVAVSADAVSLSWYDNSADEAGYYIQRSEDGLTWDTLETLGANTGEYSDLGLDPETVYVYRVFAFSTRGESEPSNQDSAVTAAHYELGLSLAN